MIPVDEAQALVLDNIDPLPAETIDFAEACGRLLREDVVSDIDMPPFPRSAVDGFALRAEDVASPPARLTVVGEVPAGTLPDFRVGVREACQIMTGAPVPEGADAVQMVEQSRWVGTDVEILTRVASRQNVAPKGSEVRKGDIVLRRGTRLDPPAVAVAATVGKTRIEVGPRPKVAVIATGDELVAPSETPGPGQIRNSNAFSLVAQCRAAGAAASFLGVARDDEASLETLIRKGLDFDVLLLSGGVSMGRFDLVEKVLETFGVRFLFDAVRLKPGKPLVFGLRDGTLVFGLPGNPVSTMVTFELFVRTALARLEGAEDPTRAHLCATLEKELRNRGARRAFIPGWVRTGESGELHAFPIATRGSGDVVAFSKSNALLIVPEDIDKLEAGDDVRFYPLDSFLIKEDIWQAGRNPS